MTGSGAGVANRRLSYYRRAETGITTGAFERLERLMGLASEPLFPALDRGQKNY